MITIIGTGHVFNIGLPVMNMIKRIWPDAVLVELDVTRYNAMTSPTTPSDENKLPWIYRRAAKYQNQVAGERRVGEELLVAVNTGKLIGAEIGFIDTDAYTAMGEMWDEMPFREKARYFLSTYTDRVKGAKGAEKVAEEFGKDEERMISEMRRKYPTFVRKLIDERNEHMASQIIEYKNKYNNIVVVCGDAHVEGIASIIGEDGLTKVRLSDLMDADKLKTIYSNAWNHEGEIQ